MDHFEYVVALLAIITGLALADVAGSLHRLLKRRALVKWDWLVLATAAYVSFIVVRYWYQVWSIHDLPGVTNLFFFLGIIVENLLLFLMAASSLPDEEDYRAGGLNLREFGQKSRSYIWTVFTLFVASWAAHGLLILKPSGAQAYFIFIIPLVLGVGLVFSSRRSIHIALFLALIAHESWWMFTIFT